MKIETVTMLKNGDMAVKFQGKKKVSIIKQEDKIFQVYTIWHIINRDDIRDRDEKNAQAYQSQL